MKTVKQIEVLIGLYQNAIKRRELSKYSRDDEILNYRRYIKLLCWVLEENYRNFLEEP